MVNPSEIIEYVIEKSNIVLHVLDSRMIQETRNKDIEEKIRRSKKKIIYVINKSDLVNEKDLRQKIQTQGLGQYVIVSATKGYGVSKLREQIKITAKNMRKSQVNVGVVGYSNVGKSTIINCLKRKKVTQTSPRAGYTRGVHRIRLDSGITLIDSPGDLGSRSEDQVWKAKIGTIAIDKIKDPDIVASDLIDTLNGKIEKHYNIDRTSCEHAFDVLEAIALKFHMLRKGGEPDVDKASRMVIKHWQSGKIR
ncbi:MAG: GTPase [Candidatus Hodarchaeota archaeon]